MPPAKKRPPAPIDRPLSKAYLREFKGWATSHSPGLSDPASLRIMENCWVTREGALSVRPALRSAFAFGSWVTTNYNARIIGSFESFFLNDGTKAMLFATKESTGDIQFRVARYNPHGSDTPYGFDPGPNYTIITLAEAGFTGTAGFSSATNYVRYLQIDNKIFALADSTNPADTARIFYVGDNKRIVSPTEITVPAFSAAHAPTVMLPEAAWINAASKTTRPTAETPTSGTADQPLTGTLIDADAADNTFSFGFFYTFVNELGETAPSQMTVIKVKRGWSQWQFQTAAAAGGPSGTNTSNPAQACDQLVALLPQAVFDAASAQRATGWNLYMAMWSDQGAVPVEGVLVASRTFAGTPNWNTQSWLQATAVAAAQDVTSPLPSQDGRVNYTAPPSASQGTVAADRMILVNDRRAASVIRWSSNKLGEYTNFSSSAGGGYKTLTSGNLLIPACVKLWQNPQSMDTLTVLCRGVDGYSTSYYMAPAEVTGQTGSTAIMGFEETTATPGTVSPWGVEVVNQGLYHPLDEQLMKSTASNYAITHKSMTEAINNQWMPLQDKHTIVSAAMDSRIYYVVHNPDGEELEEGCMGNELWVLDVSDTEPMWSRWLVQANSLHKLEMGNKLYMSVVRPDAVFVLDDEQIQDEFSVSGGTNLRSIPWRAETNTQGANRAHDAWAHLQQISVVFGNFHGTVRYGVRGWDVNGKQVDISKIFKDLRPIQFNQRPLPWDIEDFHQIRRDMKEWVFYVESVEDDEGVVQPSFGQVNLVQYRYTPVSVNVGGEFGSVETFEYGRASAIGFTDNTYPNGVPAPFVDLNR